MRAPAGDEQVEEAGVVVAVVVREEHVADAVRHHAAGDELAHGLTAAINQESTLARQHHYPGFGVLRISGGRPGGQQDGGQGRRVARAQGGGLDERFER